MNTTIYNLLLADDDPDDCSFFKDALDELPLATSLTTVNDGVQLMEFLSTNVSNKLPDMLFLDLNMPRKSGFECLAEIKQVDKLKHFPVVIFSTSLDMEVVDSLYEKGAAHYVQKPGDFSALKKVIFEAVTITAKDGFQQPSKEHFILQP